MQLRPYPDRDGRRVWLSRPEQRRLIEWADDPRREIALLLGLHGLRSSEIVAVEPRDVREIESGGDGSVQYVLRVSEDSKTGVREVPLSGNCRDQIRYMKKAAGLRRDSAVVDVSTRALRDWITELRECGDGEEWRYLGWHDLRRTWATDCYYSLAVSGVPVAEQLTLSWGGWRQNDNGRSTFRENYLGPVPDHVISSTSRHLSLL